MSAVQDGTRKDQRMSVGASGELTRARREEWRDDAELQRSGSGRIYGDPKRIVALLDALEESERICRALDRDGSEWRRDALAARV